MARLSQTSRQPIHFQFSNAPLIKPASSHPDLFAQPMSGVEPSLSPALDDDWLLVKQEDWWNIDYHAVDWSYSPSSTPTLKHVSPLYLPMSHSNSRNVTTLNKHEDVSLNLALPGVQAALDSLTVYESHSGFNYTTFPQLSPAERGEHHGPDIGTAISLRLVEQGRKMWGWATRQLFSPLLQQEQSRDQQENEFDFSHWKEIWESLDRGGNMHRSTSTLSSIDFTEDSFSMPATPKAKSFDAVHISTSPSTDFFFPSPSPSRPLNASASSFVPTFSIVKPQAAAKDKEKDVFTGDFTFASLTAQPAPMVKIKKDDQGFFTEVHVEASNSSSSSTSSSSSPSLPNSSTSSILLPPFLQEPARRKSKTRQIVDKLRSQSQTQAQSQSQSRRSSSQSTPAPTPLLDKDDSPLFFPEKKYASHSPSPSVDFVARPRSSVSEGLPSSRSGEDVRSGVSTPGWTSEMKEEKGKEKEKDREKDKEEGWIGFDDGKEKEKRKGLLRVLGRRRTDSLGSSVSAIHSPDSASSSDTSASGRDSTRSSVSPVSTPPSSSCDDGWIEGSVVIPPTVKPTARGKRRSPSSTASGAGTPPLFPSLALYPPSMNTHLPIPIPTSTPAPASAPIPVSAPPYQNQYFYPYGAAAQGYAQARAMHMPRPVHGHVMAVPLGIGMPLYGKVPSAT